MVCTRRKNYNTPSITITRTKRSRTTRQSSRCPSRKERNRNSLVLKTNNTRNTTKKTPDYVYRQIIINDMTDFDEKLRNVNKYRYVFYVVKGEETNIMIGRTETSELKRKFCSFLNRHNDVVRTTDARIYLVLSNDESFIRETNMYTYRSFYCSCITPVSWKSRMSTFTKVISVRDKFLKEYEN